MKKGYVFISCLLLVLVAIGQTPVALADQQLRAYNNRDIEAFLIPYADSVKVFNATGELLYRGKETMRERYGSKFERTPDLYCNLLNRIAVNQTVIEHEEVTVGPGPKVYAIVMYKVEANKIQEVHFLDRKSGPK